MSTKEEWYHRLQYLQGNVAKVEEQDGSIILYYDNNGTDKYIIEINTQLYPWTHTTLGIKKTDPPYGIYLTGTDGEPKHLLIHLFEYELAEAINRWGFPSMDWIDRIKDGDRFYGGEGINKSCICKII